MTKVIKEKITVNDYTNAMHGGHPGTKTFHKKYEVKACCAGGREGILAFFKYNDYLCIAAGDDGHWWLIYTCHKDWFRKIKKALISAL